MRALFYFLSAAMTVGPTDGSHTESAPLRFQGDFYEDYRFALSLDDRLPAPGNYVAIERAIPLSVYFDGDWVPDDCLVALFLSVPHELLLQAAEAPPCPMAMSGEDHGRGDSYLYLRHLYGAVRLLSASAVSLARSGQTAEASRHCAAMFAISTHMSESEKPWPAVRLALRASVVCLTTFSMIGGSDSADPWALERIYESLCREANGDRFGFRAALRNELDHILRLAESAVDPSRDLHHDLLKWYSDARPIISELRADAQASAAAMAGLRESVESIRRAVELNDMDGLAEIEALVNAGERGPLARELLPSFHGAFRDELSWQRSPDLVEKIVGLERLTRAGRFIRAVVDPALGVLELVTRSFAFLNDGSIRADEPTLSSPSRGPEVVPPER